MGTPIEKEELKEAIREVLREELTSISLSLTPYASDEEMQEIHKIFGPEDFAGGEFVDGLKCLGR